jgi:lipopolysaccharide transport system ATP-binding protein
MSSERLIAPSVSAQAAPSGPPVIRAEGIGKRYRIGQTQGMYRYRSLRDDIAEWATKRKARAEQAEGRSIWALKDVSFDIREGETVGIIGRNGAGKSTLLKILARITSPTKGRAEVRGRVGSLLEVGTGFHPELTGRENILLMGAVLGMRRAEIQRKFDDIVEFAGTEQFLDTPVKRYSSGMFMRLAFSVAAHLDPEILLVDEVLAVGDAQFQKKCLGRMEELGHSGRTVIFVSHSMPSVLRLCPRVILLDRGDVVADGRASGVIRHYLESGFGSTAQREWGTPDEGPGDKVVRLKSVRVVTEDGSSAEDVDIERAVGIEVEYWHLSDAPAISPSVGLHFFNEEGVCLFISHDGNNRRWRETQRQRGIVTATCWIPGNYLAEGRISVDVWVIDFRQKTDHASERDAVSFQVVDRSSGSGVRGEYANDWPGVVRPMLDWSVRLKAAHD